MSLTVTNTTTGLYSRAVGDEYETFKTIAFDSSYPTGGEPITAADLGFAVFPRAVSIQPQGGYVFECDIANAKILVYYGDNNNASDGPLIQIPNTTDLSAVTGIKVTARGKYLK